MRPRGSQMGRPGSGLGPRLPFPPTSPSMIQQQQQQQQQQMLLQQQQLLLLQQLAGPRLQNQRMLQQQAAIRELQQKTLMKQQQQQQHQPLQEGQSCFSGHNSQLGLLNPPAQMHRPQTMMNNLCPVSFNNNMGIAPQPPSGFSKLGFNSSAAISSTSSQNPPQSLMSRPHHPIPSLITSNPSSTQTSNDTFSRSSSAQNIPLTFPCDDSSKDSRRQPRTGSDRFDSKSSSFSRSSQASAFDDDRGSTRDRSRSSGSRDTSSSRRDEKRDIGREDRDRYRSRTRDRYLERRDRSHSPRSERSGSKRRSDRDYSSSASRDSYRASDLESDSVRKGGDRRSESRRKDSKAFNPRRDASRERERSASRGERWEKQMSNQLSVDRRGRSSPSRSGSRSRRRSPPKRKRDGNAESESSSRHDKVNTYSSSDKLSSSLDLKDDGASVSAKRDFEDAFDVEDFPVEEADSIIYSIRSCPADLFFTKDSGTGTVLATKRMVELESRFEEEIVNRAETVRRERNIVEELPPVTPVIHHHHHHKCSHAQSSSSSSENSSEEGEDDDDDDDDDDDEGGPNHIIEQWNRRKKNPCCLHPELWYNEPGQVNDGPLCQCSIKSRRTGIRHDIYPGESSVPLCDLESNNADRLFHYRVTMSPYTNFLTKTPTLIEYDDHEYIFEGFSLFSHEKLENVPACKLLRFNIEYTIHLIPEAAPENFTVRSLSLFNQFLFHEVLELIDLDWGSKDGGCQKFHFMPRFSRSLPDSGCKEVLSMNTVLNFLLKSSKPLLEESHFKDVDRSSEDSWRHLMDNVRGMIVTKPGMRPSSIRIDQLDRDGTGSKSQTSRREEHPDPTGEDEAKSSGPPLIIHQGCRPAQLSYAGDPLYRKTWKQYLKYRHLLNSKPKLLASDKQRLKELEEKLQDICLKKTMKREVTIELGSDGFLCTGLRADLCQHALMIPVLISHLRFHICLDVLEEQINYKFKDRMLLQLALTHTSYRTNYGTNPDHTRNSLTNCGMRQVQYGDRRVHYQNTRKRGICILLDIMSRFGKQEETLSEIPHNERLEFLGDAVVEFLTSVHLFFMFPWLEEGGLSTYRMALVQNQHLSQVAKKLKLQDFMLYVHGPDLCQESDLRHAMANCCEALMGALFLDGGLEVADHIFSRTLFDEDPAVLLPTWTDLPRHVLQQEEPAGDRHWVASSPILQKLEKFEDSIGVKFNHIRLLAKAFTHRNIGDNPLTHGHNQRLEFLGDTVLKLVASEYLYRHYPEHHEGHLSLLRSSLVNSRTQCLVYDDLGMSEYVIFHGDALGEGLDMKTKQRADMLESFVGALYVDKGLDFCWGFCNVCFFPRLKDFIMNQDWNDPKSQLQQCCLTLREVGGGEPDIPLYKVIESIGPTNTRKYVVAVYFRGTRLATGNGHSIQQAEMSAATNALKKREELFPILQHQRRFLKKVKQGLVGRDDPGERTSSHRKHSADRHKTQARHSKTLLSAGKKRRYSRK